MSKLMTEQEVFLDYFKDGVRFWTSEDGCLTDLVIVRSLDEKPEDQHAAKLRLFDQFSYIKGIDWSPRLQRRFVDWLPVDAEFFDGGAPKPKKPYAWQFSDKPTQYPVWSISP